MSGRLATASTHDPDHAFRAAFQGHMEGERVPREVIDHLVGHAGDLRAIHYGRDLLDDARAAVDALKPIDWIGPMAPADNIFPMDRASEQTGSAS